MSPLSRALLTALLLTAPARAVDTKVESGPAIEPLKPVSTTLDPAAGAGDLGAAAQTIPALPSSSIGTDQAPAGPAALETPKAEPFLNTGGGAPALVPDAQHQPLPDPYFVGALARLGVPQAMAQELAEYQASRHPGDQDSVYHGLGHSQDVPAVVSAIVEGDAGKSLSERQKVLLIVAAALHDIDPSRKAETPARVGATLTYLESDPASQRILSSFGRRYGFTAPQVEALIKATDFNPQPDAQKKIQEDFESMARSAFAPGEQAWALEWGRRLSFADKSATYLGSVESADKQVRNLANEIRHGIAAAMGKESANPTDESMLRGSAAFLKSLRDSPDFALLPAALRQNFEQVHSYFAELADPATPIPAAAPKARGPPLSTADQAVRRLSVSASAVDAALAGLNDRAAGYAVLAPGALLDLAVEAQALAVIERDFIDSDGRAKMNYIPFNENNPALNPRVAPLKALLEPEVARLERALNAALPGENIVARDIQIRVRTPDKPDKQFAHVDIGGYVTATFAMRGRGTVLYRLHDGKVQAREAPAHSWAVITNMDRERATGILGTVHDTPITDGPRVIIIVRFERTDQAPLDSTEAQRWKDKVLGRARAMLERLAAQNRPPEPPKKPGLIKKLLGG